LAILDWFYCPAVQGTDATREKREIYKNQHDDERCLRAGGEENMMRAVNSHAIAVLDGGHRR